MTVAWRQGERAKLMNLNFLWEGPNWLDGLRDAATLVYDFAEAAQLSWCGTRIPGE
jgi:hypothetical protein